MATKMTSLSYETSPGSYNSGSDDLYFIFFVTISFVAIRITLKVSLSLPGWLRAHPC